MSNYILKEFKQILSEADWMDSQSKQAAIDKVIIFCNLLYFW